MGAALVPVMIFTAIWGLAGIVLPWFVPKGVNRGIIQTMLVIGSVCGYLFWLLCYMMQMNPLFGPLLRAKSLYAVSKEWS